MELAPRLKGTLQERDTKQREPYKETLVSLSLPDRFCTAFQR